MFVAKVHLAGPGASCVIPHKHANVSRPILQRDTCFDRLIFRVLYAQIQVPYHAVNMVNMVSDKDLGK
jgi:hypothetical protein